MTAVLHERVGIIRYLVGVVILAGKRHISKKWQGASILVLNPWMWLSALLSHHHNTSNPSAIVSTSSNIVLG